MLRSPIHPAMKLFLIVIIAGIACLPVVSCMAQSAVPPLVSPKGVHTVHFVVQDGVPMYSVDRGNVPIILPSKLGFELNGVDLSGGFELVDFSTGSKEETWEQPWGETRWIHSHYNAASYTLRTTSDDPWTLRIDFRAYDDGIAFRYEILEHESVTDIEIMNELTEFALAADHNAWWIGAYQWNRYEYLYQNTPVSEFEVVHTPVTMETHDGYFLSFHEAALVDYASMSLRHTDGFTLEADLAEWSDGVKVRGPLPMKTPWRTIQIAESAGDLITSYLILNCNEPSKIEDTSWIEPAKYVGIWWEMHLNIATWASGEMHGATTENTKRYIDFAADHGFDAVLVEGWNVGWDGDWIANADSFSFTQPYPDYDLYGLAEYARERNVYLIGHNETSTGILNYEQQMEGAYKLYHDLGIRAIKTGYVGHSKEIKRRDPATNDVLGLEWHHGQWMVNHYQKTVETAADYQIMVNIHEPIKDTGLRRTWPNLLTREGARGQEFNAWSGDGGNPPEHTCILPFTRLLGGPMDFTPGIFDLMYRQHPEARPDNRINTTLAKQLALYVVIYSPLQMAADLPQNYEGHPAFQFIEDVPVDWEDTVVLNAKIGDYVTVARKDRNSDDWYLGSITDEQGREFNVTLDFLDPKRFYIAEIYADGMNADWESDPYAYELSKREVTSLSTLRINLAPGGGQAIRFVAQPND